MLRLLLLSLCLLVLSGTSDALQRRGGGRGGPGPGSRAGGPRNPGAQPPAGLPGAKPGAQPGAGGATFGGKLPPLIYPPPTLTPQPVAVPDDTGAQDTPPTAPATPLAELPELAEIQREYFTIADHDGGGWISFREAVASMDVDRGEFRSFDDDRDGRIDLEEFGRRVRETVELVGSFRPPRPHLTPSEAPDPSESLLDTADLDGDGALGVFELQAAFEAMNASDLDAQIVLSSYDGDLSGTLDPEEFSDIARSLKEGTFAIAPAPSEPPTSIDELFGIPVPRRTIPGAGSSTLPPRLVGPVSHFHRLDADRDGAISPEDLLRLQAPLNLDVRARAVVAFLDVDGDGTLDREELRAAFE